MIPVTIEKRLSDHSSNEAIFKEAIPPYEKALKEAGHNFNLQYNPSEEKPANQPRNRKRNIIWFNPPFSKSVLTKVGHCFLKLVDKHFPRKHKLHKIFNRNTVKVSYSCTNNMKSIINNHNNKILNQIQDNVKRTCNCINKELCPVNGECLKECTIYETTINSSDPNYTEK